MIYPHLTELEQLVDQRLVSKRKHPHHDIWIYNYTPPAMSIKPLEWPDALCDARGLVLDAEGLIIGRGYRKFWELDPLNIPSGPFTVEEKVDGSLILVFQYAGEMVYASRGSFTSEHASMAASLGTEKYKFIPCANARDLTFLFEYIGPEHRIVLKYEEPELVFLDTIDNATGRRTELRGPAWMRKLPRPAERLKFESIDELVRYGQSPDKEGYVIKWDSGEMAKFKFDEYKRLHRVVFSTSNRTIWEALKNGDDVEALYYNFTPELTEWVKETAAHMSHLHGSLVLAAHLRFAGIMHKLTGRKDDRKAFAELAQEDKVLSSALFLLYDGKEIEEWAWKKVRPEVCEFFRQEGE